MGFVIDMIWTSFYLFGFRVFALHLFCHVQLRCSQDPRSAVPQAFKETAGFRTLREDRRMQDKQ